MTSSISAVFFDLDGTLVDTAPDFYRCINELRNKHDLDPIPAEDLRAVVSDGSKAMIAAAFSNPSFASDLEALRQELLELYLSDIAQESRLFAGMESVLDWLDDNNIPWGVVTNKPWLYTEPLLKALQLDHRCKSTVCPDHVSLTKPDPEGLYLACVQTSTDPSKSIYIGDHIRDISAGQNAGMRTIAATYGYLHKNDDPTRWNADYLAQSPNDILAWLSQA